MLHKNEEEKEIEKLENEIEQLRPEEATLSRQCDLLHGKAMAEDYVPEKRKIMAERAELYGKLSNIQNTINLLTEKQAMPKLCFLMKENLRVIKVEINNGKIPIPENLEIIIPFSGCNHTLKMPAYELLRFQSTMSRNTALLETWQILLREGSTTTRSILCPQCLKDKKKQLEKGFNIPSKRTGSADIQIVVFK